MAISPLKKGKTGFQPVSADYPPQNEQARCLFHPVVSIRDSVFQRAAMPSFLPHFPQEHE